MLVQMADAIGRLVLAERDFARLSGFTARVFELIEVLRDLHNGVYTTRPCISIIIIILLGTPYNLVTC